MQGKYASYLFYHGLLDGEQYMTLLGLEEELIEKVNKKIISPKNLTFVRKKRTNRFSLK